LPTKDLEAIVELPVIPIVATVYILPLLVLGRLSVILGDIIEIVSENFFTLNVVE
jgi:hypothetical protein